MKYELVNQDGSMRFLFETDPDDPTWIHTIMSRSGSSGEYMVMNPLSAAGEWCEPWKYWPGVRYKHNVENARWVWKILVENHGFARAMEGLRDT